MKKNVLVTGGLGFIGSNLVDKLINLETFNVYVVDNLSTGNLSFKNASAVYDEIDLLNTTRLSTFIKTAKPKLIFHLAALPRIQPSFEDPILHDDANVRACISLLHASKELTNLDGIIYSSSSSVYGNPISYPTCENSQISPLSPYALQKYTGERYLHIMGERYNINVASLRYFNVYGPRSYNLKNPFNAYSSVVGIFAHQKVEQGYLTVTGNGEQMRDFVHVSDIVNANIILGEKVKKYKYESFNVGSSKTISINELSKLFKCPIKNIHKRLGESEITHADITKLLAIGWKPEMNLETAIEKDLI